MELMEGQTLKHHLEGKTLSVSLDAPMARLRPTSVPGAASQPLDGSTETVDRL